MSDENVRGNDRAETAKRHDDSDLIEGLADEGGAPSQSGAMGHNLHRDIGTRDELKQVVGDGDGITRVRDSDEPEQANLPRFNQS